MLQLILHLIGDYITQSDWMAQNKTRAHFPAIVHALLYSLPFLLIGNRWAFDVIFVSHFLVDRYCLARFVVFAKNFMGWPFPKWEDCKATGYPSARPAWMAIWLLIIADNTIHLCCNALALRYL